MRGIVANEGVMKDKGLTKAESLPQGERRGRLRRSTEGAGTERRPRSTEGAGAERRSRMSERGDRPDYTRPARGWRFAAQTLLEGAGLAAAIDWLFYSRWEALIALTPVAFLWFRYRLKAERKARLKKLNIDFREALDSLIVSLRAGRSVERAFLETEEALRASIGEADLTREFHYMNGQIRVQASPEALIEELAERTGLEDIRNFAAVFRSARRMGGSMVGIMASAARVIGDKIDVEREIEAAVAAKSFEQKIMAGMPALFIVYMRLTSPGFLDVLYTTAFGAILMTVCLAAYIGAVALGRRIVTIEV